MICTAAYTCIYAQNILHEVGYPTRLCYLHMYTAYCIVYHYSLQLKHIKTVAILQYRLRSSNSLEARGISWRSLFQLGELTLQRSALTKPEISAKCFRCSMVQRSATAARRSRRVHSHPQLAKRQSSVSISRLELLSIYQVPARAEETSKVGSQTVQSRCITAGAKYTSQLSFKLRHRLHHFARALQASSEMDTFSPSRTANSANNRTCPALI